MRADRLLSIVWLLQSRGRLSATALAKRLDVTPRTIQRDVDALASSGVPIVAIRGRDGGFELLPGYRPKVTALTATEAQALFAGISAAAAESLGLGESFASAIRKTLAAVPEPSRPAAVSLADRIVIDPQGWLPPVTIPQLATVQDAVLRDRRLQLTYDGRADNRGSRTVDPYGLVNSAGTWYLVAGHRGVAKFFRLSRISRLKILATTARRPPNLDVDALWRERRDQFRKKFEPIEVVALVRSDVLPETRGRALDTQPTGRTETTQGMEWTDILDKF